jgi:hypothetical protein
MGKYKSILVTALIAIAAFAIVMRVDALKKIVIPPAS